MGLDAVIAMASAPAPAFYDRLATKFREDWPAEMTFGDDEAWPFIDSKGEVETLWRYYGIGYERGPWPEIRRMIEWLWANTEGDVRYGPDSYFPDELPIITIAEVDELQAHYDAVGHDPYLSLFKTLPTS